MTPMFVIPEQTEQDNIIRETLNKYMREAQEGRLQMLEQLAAAFIVETGLRPSECELVEQTDGMKISWFFRKRESVIKDDSAWHPDDDWKDESNATTKIRTEGKHE